MAKKLYYKIGEACKSLDIQPYVLRYWETEFPALKPSKSKSGQRVYSERDLEVIRRIKELLYDEGYTIAGAKKKLDSEGPISAPAAEEKKPKAAEGKPKAKPKAAAAPAKPKAAPKKPRKPAAKPKKTAARKTAASPTPEPPPAMSPEVRKAIKKALADTRSLLALLDKKRR